MADIQYVWGKGEDSVGMAQIELPQFKVVGHKQSAKTESLATGKSQTSKTKPNQTKKIQATAVKPMGLSPSVAWPQSLLLSLSSTHSHGERVTSSSSSVFDRSKLSTIKGLSPFFGSRKEEREREGGWGWLLHVMFDWHHISSSSSTHSVFLSLSHRLSFCLCVMEHTHLCVSWNMMIVTHIGAPFARFGISNNRKKQGTIHVWCAKYNLWEVWVTIWYKSTSPPVWLWSFHGSRFGFIAMPRPPEWRWEWQLCSPWQHWWAARMPPCPKFPTSNQLTSSWARVSSWFLPHC